VTSDLCISKQGGHALSQNYEIEVFPKPAAEDVKELTFSFVDRLEREGLIDNGLAQEWKANLDRSYKYRSALHVDHC
jgi:hypothetical protein